MTVPTTPTESLIGRARWPQMPPKMSSHLSRFGDVVLGPPSYPNFVIALSSEGNL